MKLLYTLIILFSFNTLANDSLIVNHVDNKIDTISFYLSSEYVFAYSNDDSLLVVRSNADVFTISGLATVATFKTTITQERLLKLIKIIDNNNATLEMISYKSGNSTPLIIIPKYIKNQFAGIVLDYLNK